MPVFAIWSCFEFLANLAADFGVERAERLVEKQHGGLVHERAGERHALLLPTGELGRFAALVSPDELDQRVWRAQPACRISSRGSRLSRQA